MIYSLTKRTHLLLASTAAICLAAPALSGGFDRSGQSITAIFEEGNSAGISFGAVKPSLSGTVGTVQADDIAPLYPVIGAHFKSALDDNVSFALIADQPWGANIEYPTNTLPNIAGAKANIASQALTGVLSNRYGDYFSLYVGARAQRLTSDYELPAAASYTLDVPESFGVGYLVGAAFEYPELGMRVSLTYNSPVDHDVTISEKSAHPLLQSQDTKMTVSTPQSANLEFRTGLDPRTLLFGSARLVNWKGFSLSAPMHTTLTRLPSVLAYDDDTVTYSGGIGYRISEGWSVAATVGYEPALDKGTVSLLGPSDGNWNGGLGATFTHEAFKITAGARYISLGDTEEPASGHKFVGNSAIGGGVSIQTTF